MEQVIKKVVIAGGGTAGWIAAAALSQHLGRLLDITLIESDQIGTVGVGEATIPTHKAFHRLLRIDEQEFMRATRATFKLGIAFEDWGQIGDRYFHSFGQIGKSTWMGDFQHMWQYANEKGLCGALDDYCFELQAAELGRFGLSDKLHINYAYHLDSNLYAKYLRNYSEKRGVQRIEGKIRHVTVQPSNGFIDKLELESGATIEGDLFIDCTGFKGLLINETLNVDYEDWSDKLPMNSALAVQTSTAKDILPYTRSMAHSAGWQWRIPLQHRTGNGVVYCSDYLSDDEAYARLIKGIEGELINDPKPIRFQTGKRKQTWAKNCIALGLSSGFLEPLESTSIHLVQIGITRLIKLFPFNGIDTALQKHYNNLTNTELESIRDFLILHYKLNQRTDSDFWQEMAAAKVPESLQHRMDLYKHNAVAYQDDSDLFRVDSWNQVMRGQGFKSQGCHHMGGLIGETELKHALADLKANIDRAVKSLPKHDDFLRAYASI